MKILITGAFGNVGRSTLNELLKRGYQVKVFERNTFKNRFWAKKYKGKAQIILGDILNIRDVGKAVSGVDVVVHLAAVIPPLADRNPDLAEYINIGGTENIINAMKKQPAIPKLIYTSSVAVYGDRLDSPYIKETDSPNPSPGDHYAMQKLKCEELIKQSGLQWSIFRLTAIFSSTKLKLDPIMYDMPLETSLEICCSEDVGYAIANAVDNPQVWGKTFHIAGGEQCRTTYRALINRLFDIFGMGSGFIPDKAFSKSGFHCGYMETGESEGYLHYQRHTLEDYYRQVSKNYRIKRVFFTLVRPLAQRLLVKKSPYCRVSFHEAIHLNKHLLNTKRAVR
ncbi:MAG: NAD(P)-dependent oxidoreductase [Spirochaetota bacterium]|nr:MAG: NAD(P)-dependent oxidoreductase [Spirochaetota bacterium]